MTPRRSIAKLVVAGGLLAVLAGVHPDPLGAGRGGIAAAAQIAANDDVQARIRRVARAASEEELAAALEGLRHRVAPDYSDLVPQLAVFLLSAEGEREGMAPALIVERLGISRGQILRGVEPHLDAADPALREQLENLLGAVDRAPDGSIDFSAIGALIVERGGAPPDPLVRYMFASDHRPKRWPRCRRPPRAAATPPHLRAEQGGPEEALGERATLRRRCCGSRATSERSTSGPIPVP